MVALAFPGHYAWFMDIISAAILLAIIMDPLGNIPAFHALVARYPRPRRLRIIAREMLKDLPV